MSTKLDAPQVIKSVFDESNNVLRTSAIFTGSLGISASGGDNIAISSQDGLNKLVINPDGTLDVNVTNSLTLNIDAATDSIAIRNPSTNDPLLINSNGSTNVNILNPTTSVSVSNFPVTQPVSGTVSVGNFPSTQSVSGTVGVSNFPASQTINGSVSVSNFPVTQPISGSVTVSGTVGVNNFPATQAVTQSTSPWVVSGTVNSAQSGSWTVIANAGTGTFTVDASGHTVPISASALPLPTGASTSALQTTGNTSLSSIDTKTPALGQALSASSVPVVLTAAQVTTLTPLTTVTVQQTTGTNLHTVIDSGTVTISGTPSVSVSNFPATQAISAVSLPLPTGAATSAKQPALGTAGTASADVLTVQGIASMTALKVDGSAVTQPVSGSVTATISGTPNVSVTSSVLPTGAATAAGLTTINTTLGTPFQSGGSIGNTTFGATQATAANLNATVVGPSGVALAKDSSLTTINTTLGSPLQNSGGSVTANAGTNLNTSLLAVESGGHLASIDTKTPSLGQALAASSVPIVLTVSQLSALTPLSSVSVSNFPTTQAISATALPLPTGAATNALQSTGNTSLASIVTNTANIPPLGQALAAASVPVVLTTSQLSTLTPLSSVSVSNFPATQPVSAASLPLPTGASTAANQATQNAGLATINSLTPSVYDYISLSYTGSDLTTVIFKSGGSGGTTVSTLTLVYTSSVLQSVTRT